MSHSLRLLALPTLALLCVSLGACHPRGPAAGPGSRRGRANQTRVGKDHAVVDLAVGDLRACAVRRGGELRCWGNNAHGVLGDGTERTRRYPHPVQGLSDAAQVAVGPSHTCARHRDGRVSCWGRGVSGQLGDGAREDRHTPVSVVGLRDAVDVAVGAEHSCAVRAGGSVWCWGQGEQGELGDGTRRGRPEPVAVKGLGRARRVLLGRGSTCAWLHDDTVWCWGSDAEGLTGLAEPAPRCGDEAWSRGCSSAPQAPVPLPPVVDLAMGPQHACAVTREGEVRCWGSTFACEHGVSKSQAVRVPGPLGSLPPIASLAGPQCARARTGELICWGRDPDAAGSFDDYGGGLLACSVQRVLPELTRRATRISAHEDGGCAQLDDAVWCWGAGSSGQLGDGSEVSRPAGVEVVALHQPPPPPGPTPLQAMTHALVDAGVPGTGFALVWHDAPIYPSATGPASVGALADFAEELRGDPHWGLLPVRIVAAHGERLEVEPLGSAAATEHCDAFSFVGFDRYALRMFVQALDLAPVVARDYAMGYPDGSGVTLGAGVVLRPLEAGVVVRVGSLVLPLELTTGDAGLAYAAPGLHTQDGSGPWWELPLLAPRAVLTLDDRRVYPDDLPELLTRVRWVRPEPELGVVRVHAEDGCVALDMIADDPVPADDRGGGGIGTIGGTKTVTFTRVREGAPAYWQDGARAGVVRTSYRTREEPRADGERRCLTVAGKLTLCHDAADLSPETDAISSWSDE